MSEFKEKWIKWDQTFFKANQVVRACVPFSQNEVYKVHIDHVFPSVYSNRQLVIYRVYGKHKQWWHEFMCTNSEMAQYIDRANIVIKNKV